MLQRFNKNQLKNMGANYMAHVTLNGPCDISYGPCIIWTEYMSFQLTLGYF